MCWVCGLSAAYRRKLRHWLTSMLVLHLFVLTSGGYEWFSRTLPHLHLNSDNPDVWIWPINQALGGYIILFILLWTWHLGDFIQRGESRIRLLRHAANYRVPLGLLCFYAAAFFFNQSSFLNDLGCPVVDPDVFMFDGCGSWTPFWKQLFAIIPLIPLIGLLVATLVKLVLAIVSHFRRPPQLA